MTTSRSATLGEDELCQVRKEAEAITIAPFHSQHRLKYRFGWEYSPLDKVLASYIRGLEFEPKNPCQDAGCVGKHLLS